MVLGSGLCVGSAFLQQIRIRVRLAVGTSSRPSGMGTWQHIFICSSSPLSFVEPGLYIDVLRASMGGRMRKAPIIFFVFGIAVLGALAWVKYNSGTTPVIIPGYEVQLCPNIGGKAVCPLGQERKAEPPPPEHIFSIFTRGDIQAAITFVLLLPSLFIILSSRFAPNDKHWAYATVGTILGFWLKP